MIELKLGPQDLSCDFTFDVMNHRGFLKTPGDKIGLFFSGGLDSTALLYLILSDLKQQDLLGKIPVYCFNVVKRISTKKYCIDLVDKLERHFGCKIKHVLDIPNDCDQYMMNNLGPTAAREVKFYDKNMIIYAAINRAPDNEINPYFGKNLPKIDYGKLEVTPAYIAPFLYLHKPQIADIFYKMNCEWLIPYTHSCWNLEEGRCGECFACRERAWGFKMLGKDPTM